MSVSVEAAVAPSFVVTAELDRESFDWLDALRRQHFPPQRNFLNAHLTLFHKLDAAGIATIRQVVDRDSRESLPLRFTGLRKLGRGVAIEVAAPQLCDLHAACARLLHDGLTPQDRQPLRPHVTIQNKVDPPIADRLYASMAARFVERCGETSALQIWRYLGGPWQLEQTVALRGRAGTNARPGEPH